MRVPFTVVGLGHAIGSRTIDNRVLAQELELDSDWFVSRTGIGTRRACGPGESVVDLAVAAVRMALDRAGINPLDIGPETVVLHVQNGLTHLTPPAAVLVCNRLGLRHARPIGLDGVCAETLTALELASSLLAMGQCTRVIVSAAADFLPVVSDRDLDTVALFGAGAGALIIEASNDSSRGLRALHIESDSDHWDLGVVPLQSIRRFDDRLELHVGYYQMRGSELARIALGSFKPVVSRVLASADWQLKDVDRIVPHQPNAKLLDIGARALGVSKSKIESPVRELGNMGPASMLVALSLGKDAGRLHDGDHVLLLSFGLGFTCGAAALRL